MGLSNDLISQFVKITKDQTTVKKESTVYGTTVKYQDKMYVKLDGSDLLTPVVTTADMGDGERVTVMIKDHTATVTGNITSPSASSTVVKQVSTDVDSLISNTTITKEDGKVVQLKDEYNITKDTVNSHTTKIGSLEINYTTMNSEMANVVDKQASFEQNLEGFKTTVSKSYVKVSDINSLIEELGEYTIVLSRETILAKNDLNGNLLS